MRSCQIKNGWQRVARQTVVLSPKSLIEKRKFGGSSITKEVATTYSDLIYKLMDLPIKEEPADLQLSHEATRVMEKYFTEH